MKEKIIMLGLTFLTFFVGFRNIDAASIGYNVSCGDLITNSSNQTAYKNCSLNIEVRDTPIKYNQLNVKFNLDNMGIKNLKMQTNWYTNTTTGADFVFETSLDTLAVGKHTIATFEAHKVNYSDPCNISVVMTFSTVKRNCSTFQGNYYGPTGNRLDDEIDYLDQCFEHKACTTLSLGNETYYYDTFGQRTTQADYQKECLACKLDGDKYYGYGPNGEPITSKIEYEKVCLTHTSCEVLTDGTKSYYYDSSGTLTNEDTYRKECLSCKVDGDTYYKSNGYEAETKYEYQLECLDIKCTILEDDNSVKHYFDSGGTEIDKIQYDKECLHIDYSCKYHDGTYYGPDGNPLEPQTEFEYRRQCQTHKCEILTDGTKIYYYGPNGKPITSKVEYEKVCLTHTSCEILTDGTTSYYYDKSGALTNEDTYKKECLSCKEDTTNNKYYDESGTSTNEDTYRKECLSCKIDGTTYYNSAGQKVNTKFEYQRDCLEKSCSVLTDGDKSYYYDSKGEEVTKDEFEADCTKEEHICTIVDDKYFDHNGKEISEKEFNILCSPHSCEIIDDTHFDKYGNVVDKKQYELSCGHNEENPKTGVVVPIVSLVTLSVLGGFFWIKSKKTNLFD